MRAVFPKRNPIVRLLRRFKIKHSVIAGMTKKEMARWTAEGSDLRAKAGWKLEGETGAGMDDRVVASELFWKVRYLEDCRVPLAALIL